MSKKHKKIFTALNYIEHLLILTSAFTKNISRSAFASWVGISIEITGAAVRMQICAITAGIKVINE